MMSWLEIVSALGLPITGFILAQYTGLVRKDSELSTALCSLEKCLKEIYHDLKELRDRVGENDKKIYLLESKAKYEKNNRKC